MKPVKVNLKDLVGKSTSTTICYAICDFYMHKCQRDKLHSKFTYDDLARFIQEFVNDNPADCYSKYAVEMSLLFACETAISRRVSADDLPS